jgi:hypothetical protein
MLASPSHGKKTLHNQSKHVAESKNLLQTAESDNTFKYSGCQEKREKEKKSLKIEIIMSQLLIKEKDIALKGRGDRQLEMRIFYGNRIKFKIVIL